MKAKKQISHNAIISGSKVMQSLESVKKKKQNKINHDYSMTTGITKSQITNSTRIRDSSFNEQRFN